MSVLGRLVGTGTFALALALGITDSAVAQGVTTAGIAGVITREGGGPIEGAVITLINVPKGTRQRVNSLNHGRYSLPNVEAGGPYTLEVRAIGFELSSKTGIMLALGQRYLQDFALKTQVVQLEEIAVTAAVNPLINSARTGPSGTVGDSAIQRLPLLGRSFTGLLNANPQVVNNSIAGQNNRFNAIQIDGAVNNDVFGLSSGGTPGGTAGVKPISIEAMKEFQVLVAPYDVRQSGFTGGLVNAVTKSGTNTITGSLFTYFQNQDLVGKDTAGLKLTEFRIKQYGGTIGGPIIKDRLHFFVAADIQGRDAPFFGAEVIEPSTGVTAAQADRVTNYFKTNWGFDPGTYEAPVLEQPNTNVFAKLTGQLSSSHMLELTYNYNDGYNDVFSRGTRNRNNQDGFQLSNSGYQVANTTKALRGRWIGQFGRVSSEVIAGYQTVADAREMPNVRPLAMVLATASPASYIAAGGERFSHGNALDQNVLELTANASFGLGDHRITVGAHAEKFDFKNTFWQARYGVWTFGSVDSLELGKPNRYEIIVPGTNPSGPVATFTSSQVGGYLQDQWEPAPRLTLTFGLRFDIPTFQDKPVTNEALKADAALGNIDTSIIPSGNVLWAPRFGFNWDVSGTGKTFVRGGVGIFSGRPPFVWMSNNFVNTGLEQASLTCSTQATMPTFTMEIDQLPTSCAGGTGATPPTPEVVYTKTDFKWQQALKYSAGIDQQMFWGMVGTVDFLYTKNLNSYFVMDVNLKDPTNETSEGSGRVMYGTVSATGTSATPNRYNTSYLGVYEQRNINAGYNYLLTAQLTKPFGDKVLMNAAYTYSRTKDVMSATSSQTRSNFQNTVIDGDLENRNLRYSSFDVPHKIALSGSVNLPAAFIFSAIFYAYSGTPYAWTVSSDVNGDGFNNNDAIYVPKSSSDITLVTSSGATAPAADWDRLNQWLAAQPCVWGQRGQIMERGSCRNPWTRFLDVRVAKRINTFGSQAMEVTADIFNFLNLLNSDWGLNRSTSGFENGQQALSMRGWDAANNRPKYVVPASMPALERVSVGSSRWRLQLGAKYVF